MVKVIVKALVHVEHVEMVETDSEQKIKNPLPIDDELKEIIKEAVNFGDDFTNVIVDDVQLTIETI